MDELKVQDVFNWARTKKAAQLSHVGPDATLLSTLKSMAENNVWSSPILQADGKYCGMIDITDIVNVSMDLLGAGGVEGWKDIADAVLQRKVIDLQEEYNCIPNDDQANMTDSLPTVLRHLFVRTTYHHITVFQDGKACGVLSQNDVVEYLAEQPELLGQKKECPVPKLGLLSAEVLSVTEDNTVLAGLMLAKKSDTREVAVVDGDGKLVGSINATALRGLTDLGELQLPIKEYKEKHKVPAPVAVSLKATLKDVVAAVGPSRSLRAYAVDEQGKPLFWMTLNEILRAIVNRYADTLFVLLLLWWCALKIDGALES